MPSSKILPASQSFSWDRIGTAPAIDLLSITINEPETILYVEYSLVFENTSVVWLIAPGLADAYLENDGSSAELQLELQNLSSLLPGSYKATVVITLSDADNILRTLTSVINLTLTGDAPDAIRTDKKNYNVLYNRLTNTFSGETTVDIINNTALDSLTFETIGTLLKEKTITDELILEEDAAFPFSTNTELPLSGISVVRCKLRKSGVFQYGFTVTIVVIENEEIIATPTRFDFILRKGFGETKSDILKLINPLGKSFTLTKPSWVSLSASSGSTSADITITTDNSDTFSVGELSGDIVVAYDATSITIPVKVTVIAFTDINTEEYNFCLDKIILNVTKMNDPARFVRVTLNMIFTTSAGIFPVESLYLLPYFQNKAKTDVGEKIQNYFPVFQDHLFETVQTAFDNQMIYKAASVDILIEELDINYNILLSKTISDLDFFAGKKPSEFPVFTNYPLRRRYSASQFFFSYLVDLVAPSDFSPLAAPGNPTNPKEVHAVMMTDGEIIDYPTLETNLGIDIIAFPDQNRQNFIQFLNNNLVPEWFVFSGKYKITDDFEHVYDTFQIDGQKYDTTEIQKLTIETGFVLKEESALIKEIIKSKLSFLKLEGEIYRSFCISTKLVELEAELNLINYELEFLIVK